jgi:hypothetical protein
MNITTKNHSSKFSSEGGTDQKITQNEKFTINPLETSFVKMFLGLARGGSVQSRIIQKQLETR